MKILHLTLKKKWFDLIVSGQKKHEFRECKPYWEKRLLHGPNGEPKHFDEIHFRNGYSKNSPFMRVECKKLSLTGKKWFTPKHGEKLAESVIIIFLGKIFEVKNYHENSIK